MVPRRILVLVAAVAVLACTVIGARSHASTTAWARAADPTAALVTTGGLEPAVQAVRSTDVEQVLRKIGLTFLGVVALAAVAAAARRRRLGRPFAVAAPALAVARVTPARAPPRFRLPAS